MTTTFDLSTETCKEFDENREALLKDLSTQEQTENQDDELGDLTIWKSFIFRQDLNLIPFRLLVAKGVPDVLRGPVWKLLSHSTFHPDESRTFEQLIAESLDVDFDTKNAIEKDIARTFPKHVLFETRQGQNQLWKVLSAYAACDPQVGYCQGMGFIAAFLLCYTCAEDAFWILRSVMLRPEYDLRSMLLPGSELIFFVALFFFHRIYDKCKTSAEI